MEWNNWEWEVMLMASPDTRIGRGIIFSSSLSGDHILRNVQRDVARREGYAIIEDDAPSTTDKKPRLNLPEKPTDPILRRVQNLVRDRELKGHG